MKRKIIFPDINGHKVYASEFIDTLFLINSLLLIEKKLQYEILKKEIEMGTSKWDKYQEKIVFYVYVIYPFRRVKHEERDLISALSNVHEILIEVGEKYLLQFKKLGLDIQYRITDQTW